MHSFRARIERGRIIVHEPIDLPDGVISLVPLGLSEPADSVVVKSAAVDALPTPATLPAQSDQRSSS
jgi:hypothetical protein